MNEIESIKSQITQLGDMTYRLEDKNEKVYITTKVDNAKEKKTD